MYCKYMHAAYVCNLGGAFTTVHGIAPGGTIAVWGWVKHVDPPSFHKSWWAVVLLPRPSMTSMRSMIPHKDAFA